MKLKDLGWRELALGGGVILTAHKAPGSEDLAAFVFRHTGSDGKACEGLIPIDPDYAEGARQEVWTVTSWDPLTLDPSIQCTEHADFHGRVTNGLWVDA